MKKATSISLLVACVVGGAALWTMANRPCEPVAQAAETPVVQDAKQAVLEMGTITIIEPGHFSPAPQHRVASTAKKMAKCHVEYVLGGSYTTCQ